jgi:hypothetical protein
MALSRRLLIRMRSQVQVLAGPPPIPAGHSAAGNRPGTAAAGLGRAGAAPVPGRHPERVAILPGRRHDHHPPWSPPSPRTAATRTVRPARAGACSLPTAQPPATDAPHADRACLGAQWARAAAARPQPGPGPPPTPRLTTARPRRRRPPPGSSAVDQAARQRGRHRDRDRCRGDGCPAASTWSHRHRRRWEQTDATGQLDGWTATGRTPDGWTVRVGHRKAGHRGGQQPGWTPDGWTAAGRIAGPGRRTRVTGHRTGRTPAGWTAGSRTTNRLGGHRLPDTGDRRHGGGLACRPRRRRRTLDVRWRLCRADAVWASSNQDRAAAPTTRGITLLCTGLAAAATVSCRWYAAVQLAPRRTAVLGRLRVERRAGRWRSSVMASAFLGCCG